MNTATQTNQAPVVLIGADADKRPATRKQLWALFLIYKQDYRGKNLTIQEASDLISKAPKNANGGGSNGGSNKRKQVKSRMAAFYDQIPEGGKISAKEAAVMIRVLLKEKFPNTKFSVRKDRSTINVEWTDGETDDAVDAVVSQYKGQGFDGMIDMRYGYDHYLLPDGTIRIAGTGGTTDSAGVAPAFKREKPEGAKKVDLYTDFVFTRRNYSDERPRQLFGKFDLTRKLPTVEEQIMNWRDELVRYNGWTGYKISPDRKEVRIQMNHLGDYETKAVAKGFESQGIIMSVVPNPEGGIEVVLKADEAFI